MEEILYERINTFSMFCLDALTYFLIAMIGSLVKDVYDITVGIRSKFEIKKILVGTVLSVFTIFFFRGYLNTDWTIALTFILGVIGWELFSKISTIDGLTKTLIGFKRLFNFMVHGYNHNNEVQRDYYELKNNINKEKKEEHR